MKSSTALVTMGALVALLAPQAGGGMPPVALAASVQSGGTASAASAAFAKEPVGLLSDKDAERILGTAVKPAVFHPEQVPDLPECPAYARIATQFDQRVGYLSENGEIILSEFVTDDGSQTPVLEELRTCSGGTEPDGTPIGIRTTPAPGGPGNLDVTFTRLDIAWQLRARVVDGSNIEVITNGTAEQADRAMTVSVDRYNGTPVPEAGSR